MRRRERKLDEARSVAAARFAEGLIMEMKNLLRDLPPPPKPAPPWRQAAALILRAWADKLEPPYLHAPPNLLPMPFTPKED